MGKRQFTDGDQEPKAGVDEKTSSEVQGSGRFFFALATIIFDVIDDELQVSDAHKCAGKKVDPVKRVMRAAASAGSKFSMKGAKLGCPNWDCPRIQLIRKL
jgi:hypothetical protein